MKKYDDMWSRIVANTLEPDNERSCWTWTGQKSKLYPRMSTRRDNKHLTIKPHRAILILLELGLETEHFWDLYDAYSVASLEPDHLCYGNPLCVNPDHLHWTDKSTNASLARTRVHPDKRSKCTT